MNKNTEVKLLIGDLVGDLINNNISVKFENKKESNCSEYGKEILCEGWFDDSKKELVCAVKQPLEIWISVFIHEYSHFKQWEERSSLYTSNRIDLIYDCFLEGRKINNNKLSKAINKIQNMEYDCEKRSVDLIIKYKLPFNIYRIIQRSNAYIYFYSITQKLGGWYYTSPSMVKEIVDRMPGAFLYKVKHYRHLEEPKLFNLYKKYCMKKNQETEVIK